MNELSAVADFLTKYGPWGLVVIEAWVIRWLFLRYDSIQEKRISEGKENGALAKSCSEALTQVQPLLVAANAQMAATDIRLKKLLQNEAT